MHRYDGIPYNLATAKTCIDKAKGFLLSFTDSEAKTAFHTIADYIIERRI